MTKNRAHKQTVRAAQAATGSNYTTALRSVAGETGTPERDHPFRLILPATADGIRSVIDLGDGSAGPVTWLGGETGSGKTVLQHHIVNAFLDRNPTGRVIWLDPMGYGPHPMVTSWPDRTHVVFDGDAAAARIAHGPGDGPTLVVAEDPLLFTGLAVETSEPWRAAVEDIIRTGRSTRTRLLICSLYVPEAARHGASLVNAIGTRLWVARSTPAIWEHFFGVPAGQVPEGRLNIVRGQAWGQYDGQDPALVRFPPPTDRP